MLKLNASNFFEIFYLFLLSQLDCYFKLRHICIIHDGKSI